MAEVDLELSRGELVVGRGHEQASLPQLAEHVQEQALRIALAANHVDVSRLVGVPPPGPVGRLLAHVELQLGAADQGVAEAGDLLGHPPRDRARRLRGGLAAGQGGVAQAPGGVRLPGQRRQRGQVGVHGDVRQARLQAALHRDHVPHRRGVIDRPAERQAVAGRRGQLVEQHVAAAVHADQVRVGDPDHVDALFPQPLTDGGDVRCVGHGGSSGGERSGTNDPSA
jgi:hypothetical protein